MCGLNPYPYSHQDDELVNAALLSAQILAVSDESLALRLMEKRQKDAKKVLEKDAALQAELNK